MAERLLLLGRQAPSSQENYGIFIEPGARLHAWTPNHKQVSSCKVAVHRACIWNEGVLDTKPRVTEEEKAAAKAAKQAHLEAATKMRINQVVRRLKAAKDAGEHQAGELEDKHRRIMEFNARVKSGNARQKQHSSQGAKQQQQQQQQEAFERQGSVSEELAGEGADVMDLMFRPFPAGRDQGAGADAHHGAHGSHSWWLQTDNHQQQGGGADGWRTSKHNMPMGQDHWHQQGDMPKCPQQRQGDIPLSFSTQCGQQGGVSVLHNAQHGQQAGILEGQQEASMQEAGSTYDAYHVNIHDGDAQAQAQPTTILGTARSRLLRHCISNQGASSSSWVEQQQQQQQQEQPAPASDHSPPQLAHVFRDVPLFMQPKPSSPPPMFAGHIMPRYIYLSDRANCHRARAKVAAMKKTCPPLCGCGSGASPFSPTYTSRCACNCPLYCRTDLHEALLNRFLQSANVI